MHSVFKKLLSRNFNAGIYNLIVILEKENQKGKNIFPHTLPIVLKGYELLITFVKILKYVAFVIVTERFYHEFLYTIYDLPNILTFSRSV